VAWCNNIGLLYDTIASCGEDKKVKIWRRENAKDKWAEPKDLGFDFSVPLWKLSWS